MQIVPVWVRPLLPARETLHELQCFCAPPPACLERNHNEPTTIPNQQFRLLSFVCSGVLTSDSILAGCTRPGLTAIREGATQRDVHGQLGTMEQREA